MILIQRNSLLKLAGSLALLFSAQSTHAALIQYTITGDVLEGSGGANAFGLMTGDTITATGIFDDSVLTAGSGTIDFSLGTGNTMTITAGTQTLFASNDIDYGTGGGPTIELLSNMLVEVDYESNLGVNAATADFSSFLGATNSFDDLAFTMFGDWRSDIELVVVPVPAAVWLFGSGLLGLAGVARRKRA